MAALPKFLVLGVLHITACRLNLLSAPGCRGTQQPSGTVAEAICEGDTTC